MQSASPAQDGPPDTANVSTQQPPASAGGSRASWLRLWPWLVGLVLLTSLVLPFANPGLWDPYELDTADFARRTAINLLGNDELRRVDTNDTVPTVEEIGRGELPVLTLALALHVFGSEAWALRLPLFLWGLLGLGASYWINARFGGRRLGLLSLVVLVTCPLYFVQARTALGDIATMACQAVAFAGLMFSVFDRAAAVGARLLGVGVASLALVGAFYCRGVAIGVSIPCLAVGLTWLMLRAEPVSAPEARGKLEPWLAAGVGLSAALTGVVALAWGSIVAFGAAPQSYFMALGTTVQHAKQFPTHDYVVHYLGHGLYPWSAVLPVALGFALRPASDERPRSENALRFAWLTASVVGVGIYTFLAPRTGLVPFAPVFALTGIVALALIELDREPAGLLPFAMITAALLVLLAIDFRHFPDKGFSAHALAGVSFPESFESHAKRYVLGAAALGTAACAWLVVHQALNSIGFFRHLEQSAQDPRAAVFRRSLAALWRGTRRRSAILGTAIAGSGLVLSFGYYPALATQLSPVGAFESYDELSQPGEPLALVGAGNSSLLFVGDPEAVFADPEQAITWLDETPERRRWLVSKSNELPTLNASYRKLAHRTGNLPVLDARSSQSLLISNFLRPGEPNRNPLEKWLPADKPALAHPLDVDLDERLQVLGWEVRRKRDGKVTARLEAGEPYDFVIAYEVTSALSGTWKTFIHIDGEGKRFNGDHATLNDEYPQRLWQPGDFVLDIYQIELEASFKPGTYEVFFGLFSGDKRMPVTRGAHDDNRIRAGELEIIEL